MTVSDHTLRRVVVTGATGMIGSHLVCRLLDSGYRDITVLARAQSSLSKLASTMLHFGKGDLYKSLECRLMPLMSLDNLKEALEGCDLLFDCAADISFVGGQEQITSNRDIAYAVAQAALESGVGMVVHVSSISTLQGKEAPECIDESAVMESLAGRSSYSVSKFWAENEFWRVYEAGLPVIIVNPSVVLGGGRWNKGAMPAYEDAVRRGIPSVAGGTTGYVSAEDVARAMEILSRTSSAVGERFILSADNLPLDEIWAMIADIMGVKRPKEVPMAVVSALYRILRFTERAGIRMKLQSPHLETLLHRHLYDGSKITRYCRFDYTPLPDAIPSMIGW